VDAWTRARRFVPAAERAIQLDAVGHAPVSIRVEEALHRCADLALAGDDAAEETRQAEAERVRARVARLLGARPEEIALAPGARTGLGRAFSCLDARRGDRAVCAGPATGADLLRAQGIDVQELAAPDPAVVERALGDRRARLVLVASADPATGAATPLAELGHLCRERGVLLFVDASPTLGRLALDPGTLGVDVLMGDAHRGLLSLHGVAPCFAAPRSFGTAARLETELPASAAVFALGAAVDLLLELGPDAVAHRVHALSARLARGLRERGVETAAPEATRAWGDAGTAVFRCGAEPPAGTRARLLERHRIRLGVTPHGVRAAPHFYTTEAEIDALLEAL